MSGKKIIAVIGATGAQGGSVVDVFLNDPSLNQEWTVRAVTRDPSKDKAKKLKERGVDVVAADLNDKASVVKAFTGATAAFAVTNYWEIMSIDTEIQQGRNLVDAAKESAVSHFVWSSLPNVKKLTHGKLAHVYQFDGKAEIEEYARQVGIPATFFLPGMYMQSVVSGGFRQTPPANAWVFALPMPETAPIPLFDVQNTGIWVKAIVRKRDQLLGKRILGATKYTTPKEVVDGFKQAFPEAGKTASFFSLPHEMFLQGVKDSMGLPDWAAEAILEMMRLVSEGGYFGFEPLDESLAVLEDKPTAWVDFLKKNEAFKDLK
ncbi:nmrA-like family domain-containing protein 1 [Aspergillus lentulus]|uniref:NmrA-like family domain-containing protein 1 n=1 Tax=Aspergillus lentulus TaxID=293939 RepID=A0AAN4PEH0_ASPLE|nr:nmrA-like family domain-containing protein 1 [Aspergillus lentulus]